MLDELNPTEFKYAFAYLQGVSEFYKIQRFFQIHLGTSIGNQTTVVVQPRPVRMYQGEDLLKTEEENPDRLRKIILNQYIGEDEIKEETLRMRKEHTNRIKEEKEVSASKVKKF